MDFAAWEKCSIEGELCYRIFNTSNPPMQMGASADHVGLEKTESKAKG